VCRAIRVNIFSISANPADLPIKSPFIVDKSAIFGKSPNKTKLFDQISDNKDTFIL